MIETNLLYNYQKGRFSLKTIIYLIRHGESQGNAIKAFLGHTDLDLSEKGHMQAKKTALYLKDIHADVIYASDLKRAYSTALHTAELKNMVIIKNEKLREIYAGEWEGNLFDNLEKEYPQSYSIWRNDIGNARPDGGEAVIELQRRIVNELTKIAKDNIGKTVFVFTHATPIRTFKAFCEKKPTNEMKDIPWASNASVTRAEYNDGSFEVTDYSIDEFLSGIKSVFPSNV